MEKIWKFIDVLKPLVDKWYTIHSKYNVWDKYSYEIVWYTIVLTLKNKVFNTMLNKNKIMSSWKLDRIFNNITKELNAEVIKQPWTRELWYEDSLRWLFTHYPYWETNASNVVLLNWNRQILWIQYNWCKDTSFIYSYEANYVPNYIILNNIKKLEWKYFYKEWKTLEPLLYKYFKIENEI